VHAERVAAARRAGGSQRLAVVDAPIIPTIASMVRDNPGCISLGQGVVSYGPPRDALEALPALMADPQLHKYQPVAGMPALLDAIARKLEAFNQIRFAKSSRLMVTAGSNMAFLNAILAVSEPNDEFILPLPYYFNQEMAVRMCGCVPITVACKDDFQLDVQAIARAITPRTRAVVTVSPNNPTGAVYRPEDLRAVNALCCRHRIYHFSDEAYESFTYAGARHFSPGSLEGAEEYSLGFYSFSKNFGMASWRVGYVHYPDHLHEAMNKVQDTNLICAPVISQLLALEVLRRPMAALAERVAELDLVRCEVYRMLDALGPLAQYTPTEGAFYIMVGLPPVSDALAFNAFLSREYKVACVPGFAFGLNDTSRMNYQRLSYGALAPQTVVEGVSRFVAGVRAWYGGASHERD
jgi:aspartate/methionine/tyrosine aminotransferase